MKPLESEQTLQRRRVVGRSALSSIPPPDPKNMFAPKKQVEQKIAEDPPEESEALCDVLCNSYKFVVNYGVFEPNFEWMPCEVKRSNPPSASITANGKSFNDIKSFCYLNKLCLHNTHRCCGAKARVKI